MSETAQNEAAGEKQEEKGKQEVDFGRGRIEIYRSTPDKNVISITGKTTVPLMFAGGYLGDATVPWYVNAFGKTGRDTIGVAYTGKRKSNNPELVQKEGLSIKVPELEYEKALDFLATIDKLGISQADIVAESEGALQALIAVGLKPEKFRNIILVHPAGLDAHGSVSTHGRVVHHQLRSLMDPRLLSERFKRKWRRGQIGNEDKTSSREGIEHVRAEQKAVASAQMHPLLEELAKRHPHLQFSIIADKHDYNFRRQRLQNVNKKSLFSFTTSSWRGHGIGHKPERVNEIVGLLQRMELHQSKRVSQEPSVTEQAS